MASEKYLQVGDMAPEFTLPRANGELVSLSDFRGRSEVVLFFYPKDIRQYVRRRPVHSATVTKCSATRVPR